MACSKSGARASGEVQALERSEINDDIHAHGEGESELLLENDRDSAVELAPLYHESFRTG